MSKIKGVFKKKNVVVIGGAGFIGSHICETIDRDENSRVICIDNMVTGTITNIEKLLTSEDFKFIKYDIAEPIEIDKFPELKHFDIEFEGIQEIYNCATPTSYKDANRFAMETVLVHSVGMKNILDLASKYSAKVVHLSSSAIYGDPPPEQGNFKEDYWGFVSSVDERASYNEGKRFAETMCTVYSQSTGLDVKIARIFATYGPRMIMAEGRHMPDFVTSAIENKDVVVYGDKDTTSTFCYINDTVEALVKLMASQEKGPINIGSDEKLNLGEIAKKVIKIIGSKSNLAYENPFSGMYERGIPDISMAKQYLGWIPVVKLDEGLKETVDYMQSMKSRYEQKGLWDQNTFDKE